MTAARLRLFVVAAVAGSAIFVRLGVWQVARLHERQARNAMIQARLAQPEVDSRALPRDPAIAPSRRVRVAGHPDSAHELLLTARPRRGAPGVHLVTPVLFGTGDSAVLV